MPEITKRKVTMTNVRALPGGKVQTEVSTDYVRPDILDAYVADAKTRWQSVEVSEKPDAGPGSYHGATHVPGLVEDTDIDDEGNLTGLPGLSHPLAGQTFAATKES